MGCLTERYLSDLKDELPDVDRFYGKFDWNQIIELLSKEKQIIPQIKKESIEEPTEYNDSLTFFQ